MPADTQLRIASYLLGHLLGQHPTRKLTERIEDIRHCLEVAAELMRQRQIGGTAPPTYDYAQPKPAQDARTREALIVRELLPQDEWRANRQRKPASETTAAAKKKPTLH